MLNCITKFTLPYFKRVDIILKKCKNKNIILKKRAQNPFHCYIMPQKLRPSALTNIHSFAENKSVTHQTNRHAEHNDYLPLGHFGTVTDNASITDRAIL